MDPADVLAPDDRLTPAAQLGSALASPHESALASPRESALASALELARARPARLTVQDLADHAGYSVFHFTRIFTARTGIGPGRYLTALRIDAARHLLLHDDGPVIDAAVEVGFDSLSSFSRRFRAIVGVPPAHLRRLADRVADRSPAPFSLVADSPHRVRVALRFPPEAERRGDPLVWVGWFPQPAPIGLPRGGILVRGRETLEIPLVAGAPWLLGFAVPAGADPDVHLGLRGPIVAVHPNPLLEPCGVTLEFRPGAEGDVPMLVALPSLCRE